MLLAPLVTAQHLPYSTHDWENDTLGNWSEAWSDVKTPGDGRAYAVGTARAQHTNAAAHVVSFSGVGGMGPQPPTQGPPGVADAVSKVVAILQVTDAQGGIVWQRFFHGDGGVSDDQNVRSTHARAISVFPAATEQDIRIAICGETFDRRLPLSALQGNAESNLQGEAAGFVAVYNGLGVLLWTYLFFGHDTQAATVLTDVCIQVDRRGGTPIDVVTYCGLSTNGVFDPNPPSPDTPLTPLLPFPAPWNPSPCNEVYADGSPINHPRDTQTQLPDPTLRSNQWDGIVGRLARNHDATGPIGRRFHSIVGGFGGFDGLFGLAAKNLDEFAVVGTTVRGGAADSVFPLTRPQWAGGDVCLSDPVTIMHGVLAEFDASLTPLGGPLLLAAATVLGAPGAATVARDVLWHGGLWYVVGSTTSTDLLYWPGQPIPNPAPFAGYVAVTESAAQEFRRVAYAPSEHQHVSGVLAVAAWNEYPDHIALLGWVQPVDPLFAAPRDLVVMSLFHDTTATPVADEFLLLRSHRIVAPGDEIAGAIDSSLLAFPTGLDAMVSNPPFTYPAGLGDPGGGGLAVDPRGLLTVVGSTRGLVGYPVVPPAAPLVARPASAPLGPNFDAVRSVVDLLPSGICRSDRTGQCPPTGWAPLGNGGTTPACALSAFGALPGVVPALRRIYLDYEGQPVAGQPVSILVDRPPPASWVVLSGWQVGIPGPAPAFLPDHDVELWGTTSGVPPYLGMQAPTGGSVRESFGGAVLPPGALYMVQYVCLLAQPLVAPACTAPDLTWAATPAMVFAY